MKALSRTLTTCTAAAALLLATAGVAQAYDPDAPANDVAEAITAVAPGVTDVLAIAQADGAFVSTSGESAVIIPRNPSEPVEMTRTAPDAPDITVTLPGLVGTDEARQAEDGTLVVGLDAVD